MRAMILAAGLGTRLRPLTEYRAKPALPVRGRPVISLLLEFLAKQGCDEVMINLHHRSETIRTAVAADHPSNLKIAWSEEASPLGTGGGIRRAANFLKQADGCVVMAGDMLLDLPLGELFERHLASERLATLLLREDVRAESFGTIGVDSQGDVMRIGKRCVGTRKEATCGLFTGVRLFSPEVFSDWPDEADAAGGVFEDLRDWLAPGIESGRTPVRAEIVTTKDTVWEPVGTPAEYLRVNLQPPNLPTLGGPAEAWSGEIVVEGSNADVIVSRKAVVPSDAILERCVVWDGEQVPAGFHGCDGVFAGGHFLRCTADETEKVH